MKLKDLIEYAIIIIVIILIRTFFVTPAMVSGASMDDTLEDGQVVLINKFVYRHNDIRRFDIVVVKNEINNDKIIKRVIGLPGEKIEYKNDDLYVNDEKVKTSHVFRTTEDFVYQLDNDEYFVLGDNRPVSKDSRILGPFKKVDIVGRVIKLVVYKLHVDAVAVGLSHKLLNHLVQVACHNDKILYATLYQCVHGTLQQWSLTYAE